MGWRKQLRKQGIDVPKPPPRDVKAERALLGAMMLSGDACAASAEAGLTGADFCTPLYGVAHDLARDLWARGAVVDPMTVGDELRKLLAEIQRTTPTIGGAAGYAARVEETALLRRLIGVAKEVADRKAIEEGG